MKSRQILIPMVMLATLWHTAFAQPKKKIHIVEPQPQIILATTSMQSNAALASVIALQPEMPLGPQDLLKSYEVALSMVAEKTSTDLSLIVQAQQAKQISREQAEYLLQQRYQTAMMQYQLISAFHDVLKHDIDEAAEQWARPSLKSSNSDTVLLVPFPGSAQASR